MLGGIFHSKEQNVTIDYERLAAEIVKMQQDIEGVLIDEVKTPLGKISDDAIALFKEFDDELTGIEVLISDMIQRKGAVEHKRRVFWDMVHQEMGLEGRANCRVERDTWEVYRLSRGYDEVLKRVEAANALDKVSDNCNK